MATLSKKSPLTGKTDLVTFRLMAKVGGQMKALSEAYQVLDIEVEKSVNRIATARVVLALSFAAGDNETFEMSEEDQFAHGEDIEIHLGYHSTDVKVFKGIIVNVGVRAEFSVNKLILECSGQAIKMTLGKKNKYFNEKTDDAIISAIVKENGLEAEVDSTSYSYKQLIQYYSSDWDFIRMRAEANGLMVYADEETIYVKKPLTSGNEELEVTYSKDVVSINGKIESLNQIPSIKTYGWSMSEQKLMEGTSEEPFVNEHGSMTGEELAKVVDIGEYELHSSGPLEQADLKEWANARLLRSRLSRIHGDITIVGTSLAKLNTLIKINGFGKLMNGKALITKIIHRMTEGKWTTTIGFGLSPEHFTERPDVHAPLASGLLPAVQGLQNGKVKKIDTAPDGETRVLVDIPVIAESGDGIWARLSKFYATSGKGAFFMPEVDDEVIVGFLNNDPRFPIILGSLYSSKIEAPYTPDEENSIKAIITKNDLKLEFNDKDKIITIETPGGNQAIFSDKDNSILLKDNTGNSIEMNSDGITLDSPNEINISAKSNVNIKSLADVEVSTESGDLNLEGNNINVTANMNLAAKGNMNTTLEAGMNATVKSGMNLTIQGLMVMIN